MADSQASLGSIPGYAMQVCERHGAKYTRVANFLRLPLHCSACHEAIGLRAAFSEMLQCHRNSRLQAYAIGQQLGHSWKEVRMLESEKDSSKHILTRLA